MTRMYVCSYALLQSCELQNALSVGHPRNVVLIMMFLHVYTCVFAFMCVLTDGEIWTYLLDTDHPSGAVHDP